MAYPKTGRPTLGPEPLTQTLTAYLPDSLYRQIRAIADAADRPVSRVVRQALEEHAARHGAEDHDQERQPA